MMRPKRGEKEWTEWTYGEYYEWFIDLFFHTHFEGIKDLELMLDICKKQSTKSQGDPRLQEQLAKQIREITKDLSTEKKRTPEVLKITELMKRELNNLK